MTLTLRDGTELDLTLDVDDLDLRLPGDTLEGEEIYINGDAALDRKDRYERGKDISKLLDDCSPIEIQAAADVVSFYHMRREISAAKRQDLKRKLERRGDGEGLHLLSHPLSKVEARRILRAILVTVPRLKRDKLATALLSL